MEEVRVLEADRRPSYLKILENKEGLKIWTSIVISIVVMFIHRQYMSVMSGFMMEKYDIDISQTTNLVNAMLYGYACMQIPNGILVDKVGVRKLMVGGWAMTAVCSIVMTITTSYPVALAMRFLTGVGVAASVTSAMKVQALWFETRLFSQLSAMMALISNMGNIVSTVPLSYVVTRFGGQTALWGITALTVFCVLLNFVLVKDRRKEEGPRFEVGRALKEVLFNRASWPPMIIILTFISVTTSLSGFWGIQYISTTYRIDTLEASKYMFFLTVGLMLGSPLVSVMDTVNKGDNRKNVELFTLVFFLEWLYIVVVRQGRPSLYELPVLLVIMGIAVMFHLLLFTVGKEVNKLENSGIAISSVNTMEFVGSSFMNSFIGFLVLRGVGIERAIGVYLVSSAICFVTVFFIPKNQGRRE